MIGFALIAATVFIAHLPATAQDFTATDRQPTPAELATLLAVVPEKAARLIQEVKAFVPDIDSPRGLVWDHDRLYLLHPPDISVFFDRDGDGVAEERKTLV